MRAGRHARISGLPRRAEPAGRGRLRAGLIGTAALLALLTGAGAAPAAEPQEAPAPRPTALAQQIVEAFDALFAGPHPGMRAVHAKGVLCQGVFTPTDEAPGLSRAPHLAGGDVPVVVRFSNFAGVPDIGDGDPHASPRGMAVKFALADGGEVDIVAHSYNGFPAATPEEFLAFLRAVGAREPGRLEAHLATHPAARTFAAAPKPAPVSYATEAFHGVNAFRFTNAAGEARFGRYRIEPVAGLAHLGADEAAGRPTGYLRDELVRRLGAGPVAFRLRVQLAGSTDSITDGTVPWPEDRRWVDLGTITLTGLVADGDALQRSLLFTPLNLAPGIAPSADPMLVARNRAYGISHERRARPALAGDVAAVGAAR